MDITVGRKGIADDENDTKNKDSSNIHMSFQIVHALEPADTPLNSLHLR